MISEKDVMQALDNFGNKIKQLKNDINNRDAEIEKLKNEILDKSSLIAELNKELDDKAVEIEKIKKEKLDTAADEIQQQTNDLKKELSNFSSDLFNENISLRNSIDSLKKQLDEKEEKIKELMTPKEVVMNDNIDSMMRKIKVNEVETSAVDKKLDEIKNERFTQQYEWGRATKSTLELFIKFIKRLWYQAPKVGGLYILNKVEECSNNIDTETLSTFYSYLMKSLLISKRDNGDIVSSFSEDDAIKKVSLLEN